MSDSIDKPEKFVGYDFLMGLCKDTKVAIHLLECDFGHGWADIVRAFISKVGNYSIYITSVSDKNDFLDIEVDMRLSSRAKLIYTAILKAKHDSSRTCAHCGNKKLAFEPKLCKECNQNAGKLNVTGTWLDNFKE